ncbi:MAG: IS4 family transposase [Thiohalocapsa sp.]
MSKAKKPRNADHVRRKNAPMVSNEVIEERLASLLTPAILGQQGYARLLGLRERILSFPVMVAAVLTLLWRQVPSVCELSRTLAREDCLWAGRLKVTQQALSQRLLSFPAELFQRVLMALLPRLQHRWAQRSRPLAVSVVRARESFREVLVVDGSTLEALFRKLKALQELTPGTLAGKLCTVIDLASRLPRYVWFTDVAQAHDTNFLAQVLKVSRPGTLWIFDRGFYDFGFFAQVIDRGAAWITRSKSNLAYSVSQVLEQNEFIRDRLVSIEGCAHPLRLVEMRFGRHWYRYLTSVVDPAVLPAEIVADLYRRRWRIEEAFFIVKRVLNLSYLWTGSENGVLLQVWSTWLFFAVLVDLGDAVAEELRIEFDRISLEMLIRGLYHFSVAYQNGLATDLVKYFAAPENQDLGVVKRVRKTRPPTTDPPPADDDLTMLSFA